MLLRPPLLNRCGNALVGAVPASVSAIATLGALDSGRLPAAAGGLTLVAAFTALAVRSYRMRVETTTTTLTVYGMLCTRRIARKAIESLGKQWTSYAAMPALASGVTVPSIRWHDAEGRSRATPVWALATSRRELGAWRRNTMLQTQRLEIWVNADERFIPQ